MRDDSLDGRQPHGTAPGMATALRPVPFFEPDQPAAEHLMELAPDRLAELLSFGRRQYGDLLLRLGDDATWRWLERADNPYLQEIDRVRRRLDGPGAVLLNMSYEWSCTAGVGPDPAGSGSRMLRALDWPLTGLGRTVVVARQYGPAGDFFNVTWPGYVGVLTAMAPGRFSAAINQPPLRRVSRLMPLDWVMGRVRLWRQRALPPGHLLRRVFETCTSYAEAKRMLVATPLCLPAFYCLSGAEPGEGCVIERLEEHAVVHEAPTAISNHWRGIEQDGYARGNDSPERCDRMLDTIASTPARGAAGGVAGAAAGGAAGGAEGNASPFGWLVPPLLNDRTRLAVVANAGCGHLAVQGWERTGPATEVFTLDAPPGGRSAARGRTTPAPPPEAAA